ncbi:hypothetical protein DICA1_C02762 [Diutina catenulata]
MRHDAPHKPEAWSSEHYYYRKAQYYHELEQQRTRCRHLLERLDDDVLAEICLFLDPASLISMVKALSGIERFKATRDRIASVKVDFNSMTEPHLQADVMRFLRNVKWTTDNLLFMTFLAKQHPGYDLVGDFRMVLYPGDFDPWPSSATTLYTPFNGREHLPDNLRSLHLYAREGPVTVSLPQTLRELVLEGTKFRVNTPFPRLDSLKLDLEALDIKDDVPLYARSLSIGVRIDFKAVQPLVNRCQGLRRLTLATDDIEFPESVVEIELDCVAQWPKDPRVTRLVWLADDEPQTDLPNLKVLRIEGHGFEEVLVPASVQSLTLESREEVKLPKAILSAPSHLVVLVIEGQGNHFELPSLKSLTSLEKLTIQDCLVDHINVDGPQLIEVTVESCDLRSILFDFCSKVKRLQLRENELTFLPPLPDTLEALDLTDNRSLKGLLVIAAVNLVDLAIDGCPARRVYYNSTRLCNVRASWESIGYFGLMDQGFSVDRSTKLVEWQYTSAWQRESTATTVALKLTDAPPRLPETTEMLTLEVSDRVRSVNWEDLWEQTPNLKYLTINFGSNESCTDNLVVPASVMFLKLVYPNDDDDFGLENFPDLKITFTSTPTSLVVAQILNRNDHNDPIVSGDHPNLTWTTYSSQGPPMFELWG